MNVIKDFRNELFKRQEISAEIEGEKNPSFNEILKMTSEKTGKPEKILMLEISLVVLARKLLKWKFMFMILKKI